MSSDEYPIIDVCFYGQKSDGKWLRYDRFVYPYCTKEMIDIWAKNIKNDNDMEYISWGIDSTVWTMDIHSQIKIQKGNIFILDMDVSGNYHEVTDDLISIILNNTTISVRPDIYKTGSGIHLYFFDLIDTEYLRRMMKQVFIQELVDDKFWKTTLKLGSSVLRLSDEKKGNKNKIVPYMINEEFNKDVSHLRYFVTNILGS